MLHLIYSYVRAQIRQHEGILTLVQNMQTLGQLFEPLYVSQSMLALKHLSDPGSFVDQDMFCRFSGIGVGHEVQFPSAQQFRTEIPGNRSADEEMDINEEEFELEEDLIVDFDSSNLPVESSWASHASGSNGGSCADDDGEMAEELASVDNKDVPLAVDSDVEDFADEIEGDEEDDGFEDSDGEDMTLSTFHF